MTTDELTQEFAKTSGKFLVTDLIFSLNEMQSKDPAFAMAAAADAVLAFEALLKQQTNAREDHIQLACQLASAAFFNSSTNMSCDIRYLDEEELE